MMAGPLGEDQCDVRATIWRGKIRPSAEPPICRELYLGRGSPFIYAGPVVLPGKCRNHFRHPLSLLVRKWRPASDLLKCVGKSGKGKGFCGMFQKQLVWNKSSRFKAVLYCP